MPYHGVVTTSRDKKRLEGNHFLEEAIAMETCNMAKRPYTELLLPLLVHKLVGFCMKDLVDKSEAAAVDQYIFKIPECLHLAGMKCAGSPSILVIAFRQTKTYVFTTPEQSISC